MVFKRVNFSRLTVLYTSRLTVLYTRRLALLKTSLESRIYHKIGDGLDASLGIMLPRLLLQFGHEACVTNHLRATRRG